MPVVFFAVCGASFFFGVIPGLITTVVMLSLLLALILWHALKKPDRKSRSKESERRHGHGHD